MNISEYEVFKFGENKYTEFFNNGKIYLLNKEPYLDIVLTDKCQSNCNFCIADLIHKKLDGNFEIFKEKILYAVNNMNVKEVLLLGGEPTLSKMLIPMIKWLKTLNLDKIVMTSNGIRLATDNNFREEVLSSGLTNINISFMNIDESKQKLSVNSKHVLNVSDISKIYISAKANNVKLRINNNIYFNNNDTISEMIKFYDAVSKYCDSIKFSPLLETDSFSVVDYKTIWAKENRLTDDMVYKLFTGIQNYYADKHNMSIIENDLQFGFVKNTMIPLKVPIILNWNFGNYTGMMKRVVEKNQINNLKLLSNNELSLSWNRELSNYFINTEINKS